MQPRMLDRLTFISYNETEMHRIGMTEKMMLESKLTVYYEEPFWEGNQELPKPWFYRADFRPLFVKILSNDTGEKQSFYQEKNRGFLSLVFADYKA